jgi:dGTPase
LPDFTTFDGNAQGLRILTKLQWNTDEFGLNLTLSQIAAFLKYVRPPYAEAKPNRPFEKKPGFFFSEEPIVRKAWSTLGLKQGQRHPLAYIMEASDDIAYCLSDIEDALEKELTDEERFRKALEEIWQDEVNKAGLSDTNFLPTILKGSWESGAKSRAKNARFFKFKINFTRQLTTKAAKLYVENHAQILNGTAQSLLELSKPHKVALDSLKTYARRNIFTTTDAEHLELAGFQVVKGLLEHLRPLLVLPEDKFAAMVDVQKLSGLDLERRLFNLLPKKHLLAYKEAVHGKHRPDKVPPALVEWFARAHLMVDFISGMTDRYALETYQLLAGIKV